MNDGKRYDMNNTLTFTLNTFAFGNGDSIPIPYTCDGENHSPALNWNRPPEESLSLALLVEDPDAPSGTFVHWVLYNMVASCTNLVEAQPIRPSLAGIGTQGINDFRRNGYDGPCPPRGKPHRYFFRLYALDITPNLPVNLTGPQLRKAIAGHILAAAEWMGTYQR